MTYTSYIYPGEYEIIKCGETEYIYSPKSIQELAREYDFTAKSYSKSIVQDIIRLNLDSKKEILEFHKIYGLLINTQNDPDNPTFLGIPITKEVKKAFVFPKSSGCSMSLILFRYFVELIRNILNLTTEIAINENYKKPTNSSEYQCNLHKSEHMKNSLRIVQSFLSLLYQPNAMYGTMQKGITYVLGGMTPLSRFALHYHSFAKSYERFFSNDFIHKFNHSLLNLSEENEKLFEPFKPTKNRQANYSEPDQPAMFEPEKTIEFGPLIFNEDDIKKRKCNAYISRYKTKIIK